MLISYPILPAAAQNADEDVYFANILEHVIGHEGRYPVSSVAGPQGPLHRWHGGVHLACGNEPLRAIADGTVVAFRFAASRETYEGLGAYDTSFVLLRHETLTGENTTVVFYSLYMHLANRADLLADRFRQVPPWMREAVPGPGVQRPANCKAWRKDVLGFAGQLYGAQTCHFEIFTTDEAFNGFWRDSRTVTQGTGSADFFGDAHFVIPASQQFSDRHPRAAATGPHRIDFPGSSDFALPTGQAGRNNEVLHVSVSLDRGRRVTTTSTKAADGSFVQVGAPVVQDNYEYELYRLAQALYPDCPSAGLEWLRFGRVLGPDRTTRNENWQLVRYSADAIGYIDLAPQAIAKLSDADFPHWQGWERRDEGQTANAHDGLCDDARTIALASASDPSSARKVRHLICKAPSEWDASDLATRYAALRTEGQPLASSESWQWFEDHVCKMAFWTDAGLPTRAVWHFHPLQFIRHFRRCGWLSEAESVQCVPRRFVAEHHASRTIYRSTINLGQAQTRIRALGIDLNQTLRKYCVTTKQRTAVFLANAIVESSYLARFYEGGRGAGHRYGEWYGRGIIQITWEENYLNYFEYRGRNTSDPVANVRWRNQVETDTYDRCDSAGFWWIRNVANRPASLVTANQEWQITVCENFDFRRRRCLGRSTNETRLSNPTLDSVGRLVNTGSLQTTGRVNGLAERRDIFTHVQSVLTDMTYVDALHQNVLIPMPPFLLPQR